MISGNVLTSGRMLESESWIHKSLSLSTVETKLRELLLELGREEQIMGVQVCLFRKVKQALFNFCYLHVYL